MNKFYWTTEDYLGDKCALSDVATEKPLSEQQQAEQSMVPADRSLPISEQLKRDALTAYRALGGPEYLKRNPELLDKALLKMIAEPDKHVNTQLKITIDAPWMHPDRLSYQRGLPPPADIVDIEPLDQSVGWTKDPIPQRVVIPEAERPQDWRPDKPTLPGPLIIPKGDAD